MQSGVCAALRSAGIDHYDFKHPRVGENGFHWSEVMPSYRRLPANLVTPELMYKMVDFVAPSLWDLLGWLGVRGSRT